MEQENKKTGLEVRPQFKPDFSRTLFLTLKSIRYRLFRSVVTVGVITIAVVFFMNTLSESLIKRSLKEHATKLIEESRTFSLWMSKFSVPLSYEDILKILAGSDTEQVITLNELQSITKIPPERFDILKEDAVKILNYLKIDLKIEDLNMQSSEIEKLDLFINPQIKMKLKEKTEDFFQKYNINKKDFLSLCDRFKDIRKELDRIRDAEIVAIKKFHSMLNGRDLIEVLAAGDLSLFRNALKETGFVVEEKILEKMKKEAFLYVKITGLEEDFMKPEIRKNTAAMLDLEPSQITIDTLWSILSKKNMRNSYIKMIENIKGRPFDISTEDMENILKKHKKEVSLRKIERMLSSFSSDGLLGIGERMTWLLFVSLLLCVVGISNAMFMSVTERFREIAVMKCLGGIDGFIMGMFVLEAAISGLIGGVFGAILGLILATFRMFASFGNIVWHSFSFIDILISFLFAVILGIILASVAALYPSFKAARLPPMEAMRIE